MILIRTEGRLPTKLHTGENEVARTERNNDKHCHYREDGAKSASNGFSQIDYLFSILLSSIKPDITEVHGASPAPLAELLDSFTPTDVHLATPNYE
jgi:hypothetical protein